MNAQLSNLTSELSSSLIPLCTLEELPQDIGRTFRIHNRSIAVFKTRSGNLVAVENRCPHKGGPLADGILAGHQIVCPMHAFRYDLATGECDQANACHIQTYKIELRENTVFLHLPNT